MIVIVLGARALAHPLGNFTINHLAKIDRAGGELHVRYVIDIAEIPSFQIMHAAGGNWNPARSLAWERQETGIVAHGFTISSDGKPLNLRVLRSGARSRPGAGGLPLLYWTADFSAAVPAGAHKIVIADRVYENRRIGWRDIVIGPQYEPTHELLSYPSALIGSPRSVTDATFALAPDGSIGEIHTGSTSVPQLQNTNSIISQTLLSQMFMRADQSPFWILITILAAFGFGALHAIEPGHGKALLAFTLVGARATTKQAAILAASLTFAHTIGVVLLGVVLFFATGFVPETIYPWITLGSGIVIVLVGGRSLWRYLRATGSFEHTHLHEHDGAHPHDHGHEHGALRHTLEHTNVSGHGHEHQFADDHLHAGSEDVLVHTHGGRSHAHVIAGSRPLNFGSAIWAALSGGIAPCPAAIILLIAAVNSHRIGYGLLLIVIFGMGLASVLTGLGIAVVRGASWIASNAKYERYVRFGPLASAALISVIGCVLLGQGFVQVGVRTNVFIVAALALAAIAGYALTGKHHTHRRGAQPA